MVVIFIAIDPVELQPLSEFRSEAYFASSLREGLPYTRVAKQEAHFRLLDLTPLNELRLTSSFDLPKDH
jgi:hypothetical protein